MANGFSNNIVIFEVIIKEDHPIIPELFLILFTTH